MEPLIRTEDKQEFSCFIPYQRSGTSCMFYLQKRGENAKRLPGMIGLFGGRFEDGEDAQKALLREIQEELTYVPIQPVYFTRYEIKTGILHVFIEEVDDRFESMVQVEEGEYGKFFSLPEIEEHPKTTLFVKMTTRQIHDSLFE